MRLTTLFCKKKNDVENPKREAKTRLRGAAALKKEKKALEIIVASFYKMIYSAVVSSGIRNENQSVF